MGDVATEQAGQAHGIEVEIRSGSWWRLGDDVRLLDNLKFANGSLHAVHLREHPNGEPGLTMLVGELLSQWKEVDGEAARKQEMARIEAEIDAEQTELRRLASNVSRHSLPNSKRIEGAVEGQGGKRLPALVNESKSLQEAQKRLMKKIEKLTPYQAERADAVLAQCAPAMALVANARKALAQLALYTGETLHAEQWLEGKPAAPEEPLRFHQSVRHLNEITTLRIMEGGVDWDDIESVIDSLKRDPKMLDQLCPSQRGVVAARMHSGDKWYADRAEQITRNLDNHTLLIMVRNGENLHSLESDLWDDRRLSRLFPKKGEWMDVYESYGYEDVIDIDSPFFADALERADRSQRRYLNILIALAGWHGRTQGLGPLPQESERGEPLNLLDRGVLMAASEWVADEEFAIDEEAPRWRDIQYEANRVAMPGDRAVVRLVRGEMDEGDLGDCNREEWYSKPDRWERYKMARVPDLRAIAAQNHIFRLRGKPGSLYVLVPVQGHKGKKRLRLDHRGPRYGPDWLAYEHADPRHLRAHRNQAHGNRFSHLAPMLIPALAALERDGMHTERGLRWRTAANRRGARLHSKKSAAQCLADGDLNWDEARLQALREQAAPDAIEAVLWRGPGDFAVASKPAAGPLDAEWRIVRPVRLDADGGVHAGSPEWMAPPRWLVAWEAPNGEWSAALDARMPCSFEDAQQWAEADLCAQWQAALAKLAADADARAKVVKSAFRWARLNPEGRSNRVSEPHLRMPVGVAQDKRGQWGMLMVQLNAFELLHSMAAAHGENSDVRREMGHLYQQPATHVERLDAITAGDREPVVGLCMGRMRSFADATQPLRDGHWRFDHYMYGGFDGFNERLKDVRVRNGRIESASWHGDGEYKKWDIYLATPMTGAWALTEADGE